MLTHDWEYGYNQGVSIEDGHILWYEKIGAVAFASGAACEQTFEHFLANGPWMSNAPPEIIEKLTVAVREEVAARPPKKADSPTT